MRVPPSWTSRWTRMPAPWVSAWPRGARQPDISVRISWCGASCPRSISTPASSSCIATRCGWSAVASSVLPSRHSRIRHSGGRSPSIRRNRPRRTPLGRLMRREIIINASASETRIALLEDKELVEILVERPEALRRVGDIYKGRVNAVLPGMQAAFVDLGLEKSAFLHASDLMPDSDLDDMFDEDEDGDDRKRGGNRGRRDETPPRIEDALKKGQ